MTVLYALSAAAAAAHPMGNFTINHFSRLRIERSDLRLKYVLDMAELPTVVERQDMDRNQDNDVSDDETRAYIQSRSPRWIGKLTVMVDDKAKAWALKRANVHFTPGVANLATMRIDLEALIPLAPGKHQIAFKDGNYPERPGWKEIVVVAAPGINPPAGNAPNKELSRELRSYPVDLLATPPQDSSADFSVDIPAVPVAPRPGPKPVAALPAVKQPVTRQPDSTPPFVPLTEVLGIDMSRTPKQAPLKKPRDVAQPIPSPPPAPSPAIVTAPPIVASPAPPPSRWSRAFHSLVTVKRITPGILLTSLLVAFCLGGIHALQPGHGKTLVAAYLVGQRGTARHAILLGITVTLSHTFGVFLLGAVALYGSQFILPEVLQPWMGVASGLLVALIGGAMLASRLREIIREHAHQRAHSAGTAHEHHELHGHEHHHGHGAASHSHGPMGEHSHAVPDSITLGSLLALGISGGIVPCPDALIVLLGAIAIHQTLYGMALIVAFSAGLALTLTAAGLAVVWGQHRTPLARLTPQGVRTVSIVGNTVVLAIGIALAVQSLIATGVLAKRR